MDQATNPQPSTKGASPKLPGAFDLFKPSWAGVQRNMASFLSLYGVTFVLGLVMGVVSIDSSGQLKQGILGLVALLAVVVLSLLLAGALVALQLLTAKGERVSAGQAFALVPKWGIRVPLLFICMGFMIALGFLLLIVPGFFMIRRYFLAPYYLVDRNLKISEAMRQSAAVTKTYSGAIWGVIGVEVLISMVGIIPFVGSLLSLALDIAYSCAPAIRYLQIDKASHHATA